MDVLEFRGARLPHDPGAPSDCFLDLVVNGRSLKAYVDERLLLTDSTPLTSEWVVSEALLWLDSLADGDGRELGEGRVPLYVCRFCGDVTCGALSVNVERDESLIRWSDFGWEGDIPGEPFEAVETPVSFTFDSQMYDEALRCARERIVSASRDRPSTGHLWWREPGARVIEL